MKLGNCRKRAAALGAAALVLGLLTGRVARAERLWTERPAELRSSPGDDAQVVKRVAKGRSLEVVRRLGTWVQVEYEGRTGWIRRTALSTEATASADRGTASAKEEKKSSKRKDRDAEADAEAEDEVGTKAAAAGAKKTAARKKAERHQSRRSRRGTVADDGDEVADDEEILAKGKRVANALAEEDEDATPRRPRSTWAARGRLPGGPLKVVIQALSAQAFSEPDGTGRVVFTLAEGDQVRVIGRGENRWLLVENGKKRQGWIPAVAVRDHGLLLEARKVLGDEEEEPEETVARAAQRAGVGVKQSKKTKSAAVDREDELDEEFADDDDEGAAPSSSKSQNSDATLGASAARDDEPTSAPKAWTVTASLLGGFTATGLDWTPTGAGAAETATYNGPTAGVSGELMVRLSRKMGLLADLDYDFAYPLGGLTYSTGGVDQTGIQAQHHRIAGTIGGYYGRRALFIARAGYSYATLLLADLNNPANLPAESTSGPTAGLAVAYRFGNLGTRLGFDALLFGSRSQTEGSRDGTQLDSVSGLAATADVDYPIGKSLILLGEYRFGYTAASWSGTSERTPGATATEQKGQAHEISLGVGFRL